MHMQRTPCRGFNINLFLVGLPDCLELGNDNACHLKIRAACDLLKDKEKARDQECEELKAKCKAAMEDFDKNPAVNVLREKITSLFGEDKEPSFRLASTRTHVPASFAPSQKATPSPALMSPLSKITPAVASVSKTQSPPPAQ
ncbi:hypothetical protein Tco_1382521 [Tanacetum coccineum]